MSLESYILILAKLTTNNIPGESHNVMPWQGRSVSRPCSYFVEVERLFQNSDRPLAILRKVKLNIPVLPEGDNSSVLPARKASYRLQEHYRTT